MIFNSLLFDFSNVKFWSDFCSFLSKGLLNKYLYRLKHKDEKPYNCSVCVGTFSEYSGLLRHIKSVHERIKPYTCTECEKSFVEKRNMETHFKSVHERKKQYMCSNCGSKFATKRYMLSHISHVHDKNKKSKRICSFCGKSYSNINLKRHISLVHEHKKNTHVLWLWS